MGFHCKRFKRAVILAVAAFLLALLSPGPTPKASQAQTTPTYTSPSGLAIANPSFEEPETYPGNVIPDMPGWSYTKPYGGYTWRVDAYEYQFAPDQMVAGSQVALSDSLNTITQTLADNYQANTQYTLTVRVGVQLYYPSAEYRISLGSEEGRYRSTIGTVESGQIQTASLSFRPTDDQIGKPIKIYLQSISGWMTFDAVSVTATPTAILVDGSDPQPEPDPEPKPERLIPAGSDFTLEQNYNNIELIEGESKTLTITRTTNVEERDYFYVGFEPCDSYGSPCPTEDEFTTNPQIQVFPNGAPWEFSLQPPTENYIVFEPGQTTATITVSSIADDEAEQDETRMLKMISYNNFYTTYQEVTLTFKDPPPPGSVFAFDPATPSVVIAPEGTQFSVNVLRSGRETDLALETTVTIAARPNGWGLNAASAEDYTVSPESITFLPGETLKTFTVAISQDEQADELRESFIVSLQTTGSDRAEGTRTYFIVRIPVTSSPNPSPSPSPTPTPEPSPTPYEPRRLPTAYRTNEGAIIIVTGQANQQVQITYNNFYNPRVPIRPIECSEPIYQFWNTQRFQVTNNQITIYDSPERGVIGPPNQVPVMARFVADDIPTIGLVLHRFADTANGRTTVCEAISTGEDITWTPIGGGVSAFRARVTGWRDRGAYVSSHYTIMTFLRGLPPGEHTAVDGHRSIRTQTGNSCGVTVLRPTNSYPAWAAEGGFEYGGQQWKWDEMEVRRVPRCEQGAMYYPLVDRGNGVIEEGLGEY